MQQLVEGIHHFKSTVFEKQKDLFEKLSQGQKPQALFITCSDSRIDPAMLMQVPPGELFMLRNIGNMVPPYNKSQGGEAAVIEYAVTALGIQDIIVCGHSHCSAMTALMEPQHLHGLPTLRQWLGFTEDTRKRVEEKYKYLKGQDLVMATVEENVLRQLENITTHPAVSAKLANGEINLHGWVYKIETGEIFAYDPEPAQFVLLQKATPLKSSPKQTAKSH